MWLISVRDEAVRDLSSARDWYDSRLPGLGDQFLDEAAAAIRRLEEHPTRTPLYYQNFRRILLRRFPYKIFYQVLAHRVVIFRVLHAKQSHGPALEN